MLGAGSITCLNLLLTCKSNGGNFSSRAQYFFKWSANEAKTGFLTKLVSVLCVMLVTIVPSTEACAQTAQFGQLPSSGWETSKLSPAVMDDAEKAFDDLLLAEQSGNVTAAVVDNAATSLQILCDHFQEIGLNAALQKEILNNQTAFLSYHPADSQISAYQSKLITRGVNASSSRIWSAMDPDLASRQQFLRTISDIGLYQAELNVVAQLRAEARQLASAAAPVSEKLTKGASHSAHLVLATAACNACFLLAGIGLASGCSVTGFACGAAVGTCTVCAFGG